MLANGQNSLNCSEESCNNPFADMYLSFANIYNLCSEEVVNMKFIKGNIPWNKGKQLSEETRRKMSNSKIGNVPWHKGTKGLKIHSEETKRKIGDSNRGKTSWLKDIKGLISHSEETRHKISEAKKGTVSWNKGIPHSEETRIKLSEIGKKRIRETAGNWKGGISFEPYCPKFNDQLKEQIRNRDNRTCQLCGEKENGRKLDVHHIHYDKPNCEPDLITLCNHCNLKVNSNRNYYEDLFMNNLTERGITAVFFAEKLLERTPIAK